MHLLVLGTLCSILCFYRPNSTGIPNIEIFHQVTPSEGTLSHTRGVGESGTIASYAAIINALNDAVSRYKTVYGKEAKGLNIAPVLPETIRSALLD